MADIIRVDFRAPRRPRPPPVPVFHPFVAAFCLAEDAWRAGWAAGIVTARVWHLAGLMVLDAAERGSRR